MKWNRVATGVLAVAAALATAFVVSGSAPIDGASSGGTASPGPSPWASPAPVYLVSARSDGTLRTPADQTLYYNDQDVAAQISCVDTCAAVWRPLVLRGGAALTYAPQILVPLSTVARPDGSIQVTYAGHPLYTYSVDAPGHVTGDGDVDAFLGRAYSWHVATLPSPPSPPLDDGGAPAVPGRV